MSRSFLYSRGGVGAPSNEECLCHLVCSPINRLGIGPLHLICPSQGYSPTNSGTGHGRDDSGFQASEIPSPAFSLVYNLRRLDQPRNISELPIRGVSSRL